MRIAGIFCDKDHDTMVQHAVSEPYGLEKILAVADMIGHEARLFIDKGDGAIDHITKFQPDIACFSLYTSQYPAGKRLAAMLKDRLPQTAIIAGNRYPSYLLSVEKPFDIFVHKEGEETFLELLLNFPDVSEVKGISYDFNGKKGITAPRPRIRELDLFPDALRYKKILSQTYKGISPLKDPHFAAMEYSRGCRSACHFCDAPGYWKGGLSFRSPGRVVDEMRRIKEQAGPVVFYFMDLNFTADRERTMALLDRMIGERLDSHWYCMSNISSLKGDDEMLARMRDAGCFKIAFGIESMSEATRSMFNKRSMGKLLQTAEMHDVLHQTASHGILCQGFYIIGSFWETEDLIMRDTPRLYELPLHQLNIGIFTPTPFSNLFDAYCRFGLDPELSRHDRNTLVYGHLSISKAKMKEIQKTLYNGFYSAQGYGQRVEDLLKIRPELRQGFESYRGDAP